MPDWSFEHVRPASNRFDPDTSAEVSDPDLGLVMVVAASAVNRVVVCKIVERAGLKAIGETPENAGRSLSAHRPGTVIIDGGPRNTDCDPLAADVSTQRRLSRSGNLPYVLLLSTAPGSTEAGAFAALADGIVPKPITPERLQPMIQRLVASAGSHPTLPPLPFGGNRRL